MTILFLSAMMGGVLLCVVISVQRRLARVGGDEEFTNAALLGRAEIESRAVESPAPAHGAGIAERRREERRKVGVTGTASLLGSEESTPCRIIDASHSGMKIAVSRPLPVNQQICVEWGRQFFVGGVSRSETKSGEQILALHVVSTNCW